MPLLCCPHVNHDLNRLLYVRVQQRNLGVRGVSLPVCMHQPYVVAPRIQLVIVGRNVAVTPKPVLPLFYFLEVVRVDCENFKMVNWYVHASELHTRQHTHTHWNVGNVAASKMYLAGLFLFFF